MIFILPIKYRSIFSQKPMKKLLDVFIMIDLLKQSGFKSANEHRKATK